MKIILLNPPVLKSSRRSIRPVVENLFYNSAPLGLCYLAAVLKKEGHDVRIIDAAVEGLSVAAVIKKMRGFSPDIAGISTVTVSMGAACELAREIKKDLSGVTVVAGGAHITSVPEELFEHPEFDIAVLGEGEMTFKELAGAIQEGKDIKAVKGIACCREGTVYRSPEREFIADMDDLPFPARDLVPMELYRPQPNDQNRLPKVSMITSRGCPYACVFCDKNVFKNVYRSFSPAYIVREMAHLVRDFGARDIAFIDSTFTPDRNRVSEIVAAIQEAQLGVTWTCSARADVLDRELLKKMKDAGCWRVRLGVESGNDEVLKFIRKGVTKAQVRKTAESAYELDLAPKGFFMIGHLTDTRETIEETIAFACSLPLTDVTVQVNTPLRNTPQYRILRDYGTLVTDDESRYTFWEPVFLPRGMSRKELGFYYAKFYLAFYLRPVVCFRHLKSIRSLSDMVKYAGGIRILFYFFISWLKEKL